MVEWNAEEGTEESKSAKLLRLEEKGLTRTSRTSLDKGTSRSDLVERRAQRVRAGSCSRGGERSPTGLGKLSS